MQGFINYFTQYWFLFLILLVAVIALFFMFRKASAAVVKSKAEKEKLIKKLDHMKLIRETYSELTEEKILSDSGENLLEGVADNIQQRLEKAEDMNTSFENLKEEEKLVYAFHYFLEEAETSSSEFFKQFTKPLTPYAVKACGMLLEKNVAKAVENMYSCYDEDNETASVIPETIDKLDAEIKEKLDITLAKQKAAEYIKENASRF